MNPMMTLAPRTGSAAQPRARSADPWGVVRWTPPSKSAPAGWCARFEPVGADDPQLGQAQAGPWTRGHRSDWLDDGDPASVLLLPGAGRTSGPPKAHRAKLLSPHMPGWVSLHQAVPPPKRERRDEAVQGRIATRCGTGRPARLGEPGTCPLRVPPIVGWVVGVVALLRAELVVRGRARCDGDLAALADGPVRWFREAGMTLQSMGLDVLGTNRTLARSKQERVRIASRETGAVAGREGGLAKGSLLYSSVHVERRERREGANRRCPKVLTRLGPWYAARHATRHAARKTVSRARVGMPGCPALSSAPVAPRSEGTRSPACPPFRSGLRLRPAFASQRPRSMRVERSAAASSGTVGPVSPRVRQPREREVRDVAGAPGSEPLSPERSVGWGRAVVRRVVSV